MSSLNLTSPPAIEPLKLGDVKEFLRVESDDENALTKSLITAAREYIEQTIARQLITATYEWKLDRLADLTTGYWTDILYVPRPPLQSLTISYVDGAEQTQTLSSDLYTVDSDSEPGRIVPAYGTEFPTTLHHINDVTVTFVAGYGDTRDDIPQPIRHAILLLVGNLYYDRGGCGKGLPPAVDLLVNPYKASYLRQTHADAADVRVSGRWI